MSGDLRSYIKAVNKIAGKYDLLVIKKLEREYVKTIRVAHIDPDGKVHSVQLDSHIAGQNWWGFFYLTEDEILINKSLYKSYFVVSEFHQHLFNWLDKLFFGNYVKQKYKINILRVLVEKNKDLSYFLSKVFGRELSDQLNIKIKSGDLEGTLAYRNKMIKKLRKYSFMNFPFLTIISNIKFYYFEVLLYIFPPGICCVMDESNDLLIDRCYRECMKAILGDQIILTYEGTSKIKWLQFYLNQVFPIVRKGGLVFIRSSSKAQYITKKCISFDGSYNNIIEKILASNKTQSFMGAANIYIGKNLVEKM